MDIKNEPPPEFSPGNGFGQREYTDSDLNRRSDHLLSQMNQSDATVNGPLKMRMKYLYRVETNFLSLINQS